MANHDWLQRRTGDADGWMAIPAAVYGGLAEGKRPSLLAPAEPNVTLEVAQLLCSRLCHDLAGPAGAVGAGVDLLGEGGSDAEAMDLLALSASQLVARLGYYRMAFGFAGAGTDLSWEAARELARRLFGDGRVCLDWQAVPIGPDGNAAAAPADVVRLAMCLILLAADALPRGGTLRIAVTAFASGWRVAVRALGRDARLAEETLTAMTGANPAALTSRSVSTFYTARLAEKLGAEVSVDTPAVDTVELVSVILEAATTPQHPAFSARSALQ